MAEEVNYSVGQLLEAINNKADLDGSNLDNTSFETFINSLVDAKLGNIDYVVESKLPTDDDPSWYRLYKSGWVEQGGMVEKTANPTYAVFQKQMANTSYCVTCCFDHNNSVSQYEKTEYVQREIGRIGLYMGSYNAQVTNTDKTFIIWQVSGQSA